MRFLQNITDKLTDAALYEMGIDDEVLTRRSGFDAETPEENLVEIALD